MNRAARRPLVLVIAASAAGTFETGFVASSIVLLLGLCGWLISRTLDQPEESGLAAVPNAIAVGIVTGIGYIALEALVFWPNLPAALRAAIMPAPLAPRLAYLIVAACQDEVIWRLFGLSLLLALITRLRAENRPSALTVYAAIVLNAALYVLSHLPFLTAHAPLTPLLGVREIALHFSTPIIWGVVYCRRGLAAAMAAHAAAHLPIQIGMSVLST